MAATVIDMFGLLKGIGIGGDPDAIWGDPFEEVIHDSINPHRATKYAVVRFRPDPENERYFSLDPAYRDCIVAVFLQEGQSDESRD